MNDTVSKDLKGNPKRFWSAIKSSRQEANGVAFLTNKDGFLQSNSGKNAKILNDQLHSNFTKEAYLTSRTKDQTHMVAWNISKSKWEVTAEPQAT